MGVYNTYKSKIDKAQNAGAAASRMHSAIDSITTGLFNKGVSDKEQKEIVKLLDYFGRRWNIDVNELKAAWDPNNKTYTNDLFGWFANDYKTLASQTKTALTNAAISNSSNKKATLLTPRNPASNSSNNTGNKPSTSLNKQSAYSDPFGYNTKTSGNSAITYKKMNPVWYDGTKNHETYLGSDGNYYYKDGNKYIKADSEMSAYIRNNKKVDFTTSATRQQASNTNNRTPATNNNITGGEYRGTDPAITQLINSYKEQLAARDDEIYNLKHPKVYSADEVADILKADYGIEDIHTLIDKNKLTDQFNTESNAYYDAMIAAENTYRNQYLRNTGGEYERLIEDYIQSTRNNAKTRYNNSRNAMNTLQSQLYGNRALGNQDTVFNQAVNQLEQSRLAELANNPNLAKQFATNERTKLANIGLNYTNAELAAYSANRQAMANRFAANRAYDNAYINSINTLYNSAANAAISRAQGTQNAGNSSTFQKLYNTLQAMNPNYNAETIATMTQNFLTSTYKNAQASNK